MQGLQVCQQQRGWKDLAMSRDTESASVTDLGVTVGLSLSEPAPEPAPPSLAL